MKKALVLFRAKKEPLKTFNFLIMWLQNFFVFFYFWIAQCNPFMTTLKTYRYKEIVDHMGQSSTTIIISQTHWCIKQLIIRVACQLMGKEAAELRYFMVFHIKAELLKWGEMLLLALENVERKSLLFV